MHSSPKGKVWVAVRVERGFITQARAFRNKKAACRVERGWWRRMNPDYDETSLLHAAIE